MLLAFVALCLISLRVYGKLNLNNVPGKSPILSSSDTRLTLGALTWNHAETSPTLRDCDFLRDFVSEDLVVLGLQECEDIRPRRHEGRRSRKWREIRESFLKTTHDCIVDHKLGGMQLSLYCKKTSEFPFKEFKVIEVPCGVGNVIGNKGAIALVLKMRKQRSIALINCHLAAHESKVSQRNADYRRIIQTVLAETPSDWLLKRPQVLGSSSSSLLSTSTSRRDNKWNPALNRYFAGSLFMGDFNYRLEVSRQEVYDLQEMHEKLKKEGSPSQEAASKAAAKVAEAALRMRRDSSYLRGVDVSSPFFRKFRDQLELVQDLDQLALEKGRGRILKGFQEGEILFPPTYKYDKRSTRFDTSKKARCPAWTDRIFYSNSNSTSTNRSNVNGRHFMKSADGGQNTTTVTTCQASNETVPIVPKPPLLVQNSYSSLDVRSSDHRPVYASFTVNL